MDYVICIDSMRVVVYRRGMGIVMNDVCKVAYRRDKLGRIRIEAVGSDAQKMASKRGGELASRALHFATPCPLLHGSDSDVTIQYIKEILKGVEATKKCSCLFLVPVSLSPKELHIYRSHVFAAGVYSAHFIPSSVALVSAFAETGSTALVIHVGGDRAEESIIFDNQIIAGGHLDIGLSHQIEQIRGAIRRQGVDISVAEARRVYHDTCTLVVGDTATTRFRGTDMRTSQIVDGTFSASDALEVLLPPFQKMARSAKKFLEDAHPQIRDQIKQSGNIFLSGAGSAIPGITELFRSELGLPVVTGPDPDVAHIKAASRIMNDEKLLKTISELN